MSKYICKCLIPVGKEKTILEPDLLKSLGILWDFDLNIKKSFYSTCKCNFSCKCDHISIFIGNNTGIFDRIIETIELLTDEKSKIYWELYFI